MSTGLWTGWIWEGMFEYGILGLSIGAIGTFLVAMGLWMQRRSLQRDRQHSRDVREELKLMLSKAVSRLRRAPDMNTAKDIVKESAAVVLHALGRNKEAEFLKPLPCFRSDAEEHYFYRPFRGRDRETYRYKTVYMARISAIIKDVDHCHIKDKYIRKCLRKLRKQ
jgi:hypothetical protein